ncbi:uroporphyrinogen-III C-methyltransferase [Halomonas sp. M1]|uniref:uroporphyrinogen-III C-methyltransferase n=1 Tax=Halomonas sp. M1 TaxID=3035470 RepID=UPI002485170D|nr:uroporphyrinogen-III C-methyltransferase [Halomonas sp. M1]WFE70249.1 uroporphyrinogen-III C-methyltransferase [Halomonas sp. M1]
MSKQLNDQEGVHKTSADASQEGAKPSDTAVPASSNSEPAGSSTTSASSSYAAKNSRSRRRNKGGHQPADSKQDTTSAAPVAPHSGAKKDEPAPKQAAGTSTASASASPKGAFTPPPTNSGGGDRHSGSDSGNGGNSGKSGMLAIVLVIILAVALVLVAWQGWQRLDSQQQRIDALTQQTEDSASQQAVSDLESRIESGEAERSQALESTLSDLRSELDTYRSDVDETLDQVLAQLSQEQETDERDWLHAEAAYLLRLANQRLQLEGDVDGAAALLNTADARLVDADNPALTSVRREIANELAALDAVPRVDRTGIYLALNAQQERIAGLRLSQEVEERAVTSSIEQPPTGTFQRQLARFGEELKDLVVIRHHDEALETLITPEQETYLRQSLRLVLEQSQLALLKEEQELYEASLDKALGLLNSYYDTDRDETQSVINRLQELKQTEVKPELPDISASQQALANFIENRFESRRQGGGDA